MSRNVYIPIRDGGSITFEVINEMGWTLENNQSIAQNEVALGYISARQYGIVSGWAMNTEEIIFTGSVKVVDCEPPEEINNWTVGLSQNVAAYTRLANYADGFQIAENMQYGPPIRDGEYGELPFSSGPESFEPGEPVDLAVCNFDAPGWALPDTITWNHAASKLQDGQIRNSLASWFALARITEPRMIVLLGRANWSANFDVTMVGNTLQVVHGGPYVTVQEMVRDLNLVYVADDIPPLGDGYTVPDLRELASGNEERQGFLSQNGSNPVNKWVYDDGGDQFGDGAIEWVDRTNSANSENWLDNPPAK